MVVYVSDDIYEYLAIGKRDIHSGVDDDLVVKSLEQHEKELLKAFGNEIIEWFAQYYTYEGISVYKCIERLLKERGVE